MNFGIFVEQLRRGIDQWELSYEDILSRKVAFGTGPRLVERLGELHEELGLSGVAAELNPGGLLSPAQEMRSLEILTHHVMPAFK